MSARTLSASIPLQVSALITNSGTRAVQEVVQLYIRDRAASITRPVRQLKAFSRVLLNAGQSERINFMINRSDLAFIGLDNRPVIEPGEFDVWIAPSAQAEGVSGRFTLLI